MAGREYSNQAGLSMLRAPGRKVLPVTVKSRKTGKTDKGKTRRVNLSNKFMDEVGFLGKTKHGRAALRSLGADEPMKGKLGKSLERTARAAAKLGEKKK